jgi:putative membrane protein
MAVQAHTAGTFSVIDKGSMIQQFFRRLAIALFCLYLAVFPGSTLTVALDRVPHWGEWMGGALLLLQGAIVLCWLLARYGRRGALAAVLVVGMAWAVEHLGVQTGFPFGQYRYSAVLQPQLLGVVPLAIPFAWLVVVLGAHTAVPWVLGTRSAEYRRPNALKAKFYQSLVAATLVLLLDMQIETVSTAINHYWFWIDQGHYYGVPAANFLAWWLVGLTMSVVVSAVLGSQQHQADGADEPTVSDRQPRARYGVQISAPQGTVRAVRYTFQELPTSLYLLSTVMFVLLNLAHGYWLAGLVGLLVLFTAAYYARPALARRASVVPLQSIHSLHDAPDA